MLLILTWSIRGSDYEYVLFRAHTVHLSQYLIDDPIGSSSRVADVTTT